MAKSALAAWVHDNYKASIETDGLVLTIFEEEWGVP